MINKTKLKAIEQEIKNRLRPERVKYIKLENNKVVLIPPGMEGIKTELEFIFEDTEEETYNKATDFNLKEIQEKYKGLEIVDFTEGFRDLQKEIGNIFE